MKGRPRRVGRPDDLTPAAVLATRPHGTRARYVAGGCRCAPCRAANSKYARGREKAKRAGDWNGLVPAARARRHLAKLSAAGVGRRTVADISGVSMTILHEVKRGRQRHIRARTLRSILRVTVDAMTDGRLVPAARAWALLDELLALGFTKTDLARRLGSRSRVPALQLRRALMTAKSVARVERLYRRLVATEEASSIGPVNVIRRADGTLDMVRR